MQKKPYRWTEYYNRDRQESMNLGTDQQNLLLLKNRK